MIFTELEFWIFLLQTIYDIYVEQVLKRYKNKEIIYNRKKYEITWISDYAYHVCININDPAHKINHIEIEKLLTESNIYPRKKDVYTAVGKFGNKIYITIVLLKGNRCVVKTSHICNDHRYLTLYRYNEKKFDK